jgi:hypothetical protein
MKRSRHGVPVLAVTASLLFLVVGPRAHAATWFVADTGTDGSGCGVLATTPCRSMTQAIANAVDGDTISVAPGRYGDLDRNGILGEAGEENPSPGCSCVLLVDKAVIVISRNGAAVTLIDGRPVDVIRNVLIADDGAQFGQPGKGFTVTETAHYPVAANASDGIVIAANSVLVRGNQVFFNASNMSIGRGIHTGMQLHSVRIEGNLVTDWNIGIDGRQGITVSKNQVVDNNYGIVADGGSVVGNVATGNGRGIEVTGTANVTGNATYANFLNGIFVHNPFVGAITKNNMFGNGCGLFNQGVIGLAATNNYWGARTRPGGGAADTTCNSVGGTTDVTPFATKPFAVKVLKP